MNVNTASNIYSTKRLDFNARAYQVSSNNAITKSPSSGDSVQISEEGYKALNGSILDFSKEIMSKYDVNNISYNDLQKMSRELYDKGVISGSDMLDITAPPLNLSTIPGQPKVDFNKPQNYVSMYQDMLSFQRSPGSGSSEKDIAWTEHTLSLFKNLSSLHVRA